MNVLALSRKLIPLTFAAVLFGMVAVAPACAQSSGGEHDAPSQVPQVPKGWTKKEAMQWLLPNQQGTYYNGQSKGGALAMSPFVNQRISFLAGKKMSCRNILGSLLKCCKKTVPDQQKKWWQAYANNQRQHAALDVNGLIDHFKGAWSKIKGGATGFDLDAPIVSKSENIKGGGNGPSANASNKSGSLKAMNDRFMAKERKEVKPDLGWYCRDKDFDVAVAKNLGECHYLGSHCTVKVLGACIIKYEEYCCFNSPTSRILREQFLKNGIGDMGDAKHPDCSGIDLAELRSGMSGNLSNEEMIGRMQAGGYLPDSVFPKGQWELQYTGPQSTMGDPTRQTVSQRTMDTIAKMDPAAATSSIASDAQTLMPTATTTAPTGPGQITFSAGYQSFTAGEPVVVSVTRNGGEGMVSVEVSTVEGTAKAGTDYTNTSQTIYWGNGDVAAKNVKILSHAFMSGGKKSFKIKLSSPTGGATLDPYKTMDIDLVPAN